jgi:uncharacterized protein
MSDDAPSPDPSLQPAGAAAESPEPEKGVRAGVGAAVLSLVLVVGLVAGLASLDFTPNLSHLDVTILSGSEQGQYYAVTERLARLAKEQEGNVHNVATAGTLENVERLVTHAKAPTVQYGLAQDGQEWNEAQRKTLRLIAHLPRSEAVLFLGKTGDQVQHVSDLAGKTIAIGPAGSGTARLAKQLLTWRGFEALKLKLINLPLHEQVEALVAGKADLGCFVIAEDSTLIQSAVGEKGLQIASFAETRALAHHLPFLSAGTIHVGHYDPVHRLPPSDKQLLRVGTLVLSDGSAARADTVALLSLFEEAYPGFVEHNRKTKNATGLKLAPTADNFYEQGGPDLLDEYAPWLANWVPMSNLVHIVMAISILFNLMGAGHRFALWRVDAARIGLEARWSDIFGATTPTELGVRDPSLHQVKKAEIWTLAEDFQDLKQRCRKYSVSPLVPMGQELTYRYQESLVNERLAALRKFHAKL